MSKIKILYGLEAVGGGALKHLMYLATRLNKELFDITIILSAKRHESIDDEKIRLRSSGIRLLEIPMKRSISIKDVELTFKLFKHIRKEKYDVVHAHSSKAGGVFRIAAWLAKVPYVCYTPHCFYFQGKIGIKRLFFIAIEKFLASLTSAIIVSKKEKEEILKHKITPYQKIFHINNAINTIEYKDNPCVDSIKHMYKLNECSVVIGAVGRLAKQKDWMTYIYAAKEALKVYPKAIFLIVGGGELLDEMKKIVTDLNLERNFIFTGHIHHNHISEVFSIMDIYVNTSKWEGLPYVLLEAMQFKKPIIATDSGGRTIVLHEKTGYLVPDKDYKAIADKIIHLVTNKHFAQQMGEEGRKQLLEKYSFEVFVKKHEQMYIQSMVEY